MKIAKMLSGRGNDFSAMMECEHCGHAGKLKNGYHDGHYHNRVSRGNITISMAEYEALRQIQFYARADPLGDTIAGFLMELQKIDREKCG